MPTPRLLLFGTSGAGKSSLLGALTQAAATQAPLLKGELVDASGALGRLQKSTYEAVPPPTDQAESYDVRVQPADHGAATAATVLDCSGKSALAMLQAKQPFAEALPLRKQILDADAVLLLVDASLPPKQLGEEFQQFTRWLTDLHARGGRRTDIGALPVYLVLTKCDLLAKKEDTFSKWMQKIEEAKRRVDERFRSALQEQGGFGTIHLRLWATAIKRPALADRPARPLEPYGVAELFRQCLQSAGDFLERRHTSQVRLFNAVVGLTGMIAVLALILALLVAYQPETKWAALDEKVQHVLPKKDAKPAQRLGGTLKKLQDKQKLLADIESAPDFGHLPDETRSRVQQYRQEIEQYLKLEADAKRKVKYPYMAKTAKEIEEQEKNLNDLACPADWGDTPLGKRAKQCRMEYAALHKALSEREAWIAEEVKSGDKLRIQGVALHFKLTQKMPLGPQEAELWDVQYRARMQAKPVGLQSDSVAGVSSVTYEFLDKFESMKKARRDWDAVKAKLTKAAEGIQEELKAGT